MKKNTFLILQLIALSTLFVLGSFEYAFAQGWYNTSWNYRKSHVINAATGAGTNYQVMVTVYYGAGTDAGGNVYCSNFCKTDFTDIRFTASDGTTLLPHWIQSFSLSSNAVFWVKVTGDLSSTQTIYVYYGNSGATTTSNGSQTFIYYDDGSATSGWTTSGTVGSSNVQGNPVNSLRANGASGSYLYRNTGISPNTFTFFNVRTETNNLGNFFFQCSSAGLGQMYRLDSRGTTNYTGFATTTNWTTWNAPGASQTSSANQWYQFGIAINSSGTSSTLYYNAGTSTNPVPGTVLGTHTTTNSGTYIGLVGDAGGSGLYTYWDNIITRRYVNPEPIHSTWGSQEGPPNYIAQFIRMDLGSPVAWCPGETRTVTVTVKNIGLSTWTNSSPDVNIGVKWNEWSDYHVRTDANGLVPGATQTYTLTMTSPTIGPNNLTFDVVYEGICWFAWNSGSCGPGNSVYISPPITIHAAPSASATKTDIKCFNAGDGTITVTGSGTAPYTYSINNGGSYQSSNAFGSLSPGAYKIRVKDGNGCESPVIP